MSWKNYAWAVVTIAAGLLTMGELSPAWSNSAVQIQQQTDAAMSMAFAIIPIALLAMILSIILRLINPGTLGGYSSRSGSTRRSSGSTRQTNINVELARATAQRQEESRPPQQTQRRELLELDAATLAPTPQAPPTRPTPPDDPKPVVEKPNKSRWESLE